MKLVLITALQVVSAAFSISASELASTTFSYAHNIRVFDNVVYCLSSVANLFYANYTTTPTFKWTTHTAKNWTIQPGGGSSTIELFFHSKTSSLYLVVGSNKGLDVLHIVKSEILNGGIPKNVFSAKSDISSMVIDYYHGILYTMSNSQLSRYNISDPHSISRISFDEQPLDGSLRVNPWCCQSLSIHKNKLYASSYGITNAQKTGIFQYDVSGKQVIDVQHFLPGTSYRSSLIDHRTDGKTIILGRTSAAFPNTFLFNLDWSSVLYSQNVSYSSNGVNSIRFVFRNNFVLMHANPTGVLYVNMTDPYLPGYSKYISLGAGMSVSDFQQEGNLLFAASFASNLIKVFQITVAGVSDLNSFWDQPAGPFAGNKYALVNPLYVDPAATLKVSFTTPKEYVETIHLNVLDYSGAALGFDPITFVITSIARVIIQKNIGGLWITLNVNDHFFQTDIDNEYIRLVVCDTCKGMEGYVSFTCSTTMGGSVQSITLVAEAHNLDLSTPIGVVEGETWQPKTKKSINGWMLFGMVTALIFVIGLGIYGYRKYKNRNTIPVSGSYGALPTNDEMGNKILSDETDED